MNVIKKYINSDKFEYTKYPRADMGKLVGSDPDLEYYILEDNPPVYDENIFKLKQGGVNFTNEDHEIYSALKKAVREYELIELSKDDTIKKLNDSLGQHIDSRYPYWKQVKHTAEATRLYVEMGQNNWGEYEQLRFQYIMALANWARGLRQERDQREIEYRDNNIFPSFEWNEMPEKPQTLIDLEVV